VQDPSTVSSTSDSFDQTTKDSKARLPVPLLQVNITITYNFLCQSMGFNLTSDTSSVGVLQTVPSGSTLLSSNVWASDLCGRYSKRMSLDGVNTNILLMKDRN